MPRSPSRTAAAGNERGERSEQLDEFCRGLYPILVAADLGAFRRYLGRWEDLLGDTAELAETSDEQTRRTMSALLRRPAQYGLLPWPADPTTPPEPADPIAFSDPLLPERGLAAERAPEPAPDAQPDPAICEADGIYQLDMLTGELVPLDPDALRPRADRPPRAPRRRRRRLPPNLEQLPLWSNN